MSDSLGVNIWLSVPQYMFVVIMVYPCACECKDLLQLVVAKCLDQLVDV